MTQASIPAPPRRVPLSDGEPKTLVEVYEGVARFHSKPDTLNYKQDGVWRSISTDEMLKRARLIALGLYSLDVRKGDRVALISESRVEWVLADQGCIFAGAVTLPIYPTLTPAQAGSILNDCDAQVLLVSTRAKIEEIEAVVRECATVEKVIIFDPDGYTSANSLSL